MLERWEGVARVLGDHGVFAGFFLKAICWLFLFGSLFLLAFLFFGSLFFKKRLIEANIYFHIPPAQGLRG